MGHNNDMDRVSTAYKSFVESGQDYIVLPYYYEEHFSLIYINYESSHAYYIDTIADRRQNGRTVLEVCIIILFLFV